MKIVVNKKSKLGNIKTAVYYKSPIMNTGVESLSSTHDTSKAYVGTSTNGFSVKCVNIKYDSGNLGIDHRFFEYGLSYFPEHYNLLESFSKEAIDKLTKNDLGKYIGPGDLKDLGQYIIPSQTVRGTQGDIEYFGSFKTDTQVVYAFRVPEMITKIELYDEIIPLDYLETMPQDEALYDYDYGLGRSGIVDPSISIYLGRNTSGYPSVMLLDEFPDISLRYEGNRDVDSSGTYYSEVVDEKVVFLTVAGRKQGTLEVAVEGWMGLVEPIRNKSLSHLLKFEKTTIPEQIETGKVGYFRFDGASGSLLGTDLDIICPPILDRKQKAVIARNKSLAYSLWKRYHLGDEVRYKGKTWVSLVDDNIGNDPRSSSSWALKSELSNFYTTWFNIRCPHSLVEPSRRLNVPNYIKESMFYVTPDPGYVPESIANIIAKNTEISVGDGIDVVYSENYNDVERRYYVFYIIWPSEKNTLVPGSTLDIPMKLKDLSPKIQIPEITIGSDNSLSLVYGSNPDDLTSESGFYIDSDLDVDITSLIMDKNPGIQERLRENLFTSGKMKFGVRYKKSVPGEIPWTTGETASININLADSEVELHDHIDYEECLYTVYPEWNYRKVTISNSGDFAVEYPVLDVINLEDAKCRIKSILPDAIPRILRVCCDGQWEERPYNDTSGASWAKDGMMVVLKRSSEESGWVIDIAKITKDLIIDIKV